MRSNSFIEGIELSKEALWKGVTSKTSREIEKIIIKQSLRDLSVKAHVRIGLSGHF
jgi:hypothetical protein